MIKPISLMAIGAILFFVFIFAYRVGQIYELRKIKQITTHLHDNADKELLKDLGENFKCVGIGPNGERIWEEIK